MSFLQFVAGQLRKPSGFFGRFVMSRVLNRANAPMNRLTLDCVDLKPGDDVIEVGFGGGDLIDRIAAVVSGGHLAGVDFSPEMVELCTRRFADLVQRGRLELHCAAADHLPFGDAVFDKACAVNTIYFWPDPLGPLKELHRVLRSGGKLALTFNSRETLEKAPFTKHGFSFFETDQIRQQLELAGFKDVRLVPSRTVVRAFVCAVATK